MGARRGAREALWAATAASCAPAEMRGLAGFRAGGCAARRVARELCNCLTLALFLTPLPCARAPCLPDCPLLVCEAWPPLAMETAPPRFLPRPAAWKAISELYTPACSPPGAPRLPGITPPMSVGYLCQRKAWVTTALRVAVVATHAPWLELSALCATRAGRGGTHFARALKQVLVWDPRVCLPTHTHGCTATGACRQRRRTSRWQAEAWAPPAPRSGRAAPSPQRWVVRKRGG